MRYTNTQLKHKMLFGSDYPLITPDRWLARLREARRSATRCARSCSRRTRPGCSGSMSDGDLSWPLRAGRVAVRRRGRGDRRRALGDVRRARARVGALGGALEDWVWGRADASACSASTRSRTSSAGSACPPSAACSSTSTSGWRPTSSRSWSTTPAIEVLIADAERVEVARAGGALPERAPGARRSRLRGARQREPVDAARLAWTRTRSPRSRTPAVPPAGPRA